MPGRRHARYRNQRGSVLMIALLVMIVLSLLGVALLTLSGTEHNIAYNALWSEGAFAAADAGIQTGLNQLSPNSTTSTAGDPCDSHRHGHLHVPVPERPPGRSRPPAPRLQGVADRDGILPRHRDGVQPLRLRLQ